MSKIVVTMRDGVEIECCVSEECLVQIREDFIKTLELATEGKTSAIPVIITLQNGLFFQLRHMQSIIFHTDDKDSLKFTVKHNCYTIKT